MWPWSSSSAPSSAPEQESMIQSGDSRKGAESQSYIPTPFDFKKGWDEYDKSEQVNKTGCLGGEDEDPEVCGFIKKLQWDLANSYYWTGNCVRDYFFFFMNWHPLLGIVMCHPNHPWTKSERFYMFMISVGLTFVPSVAIAKLKCVEATEDPSGTHSGEVVTVTTTMTTITTFLHTAGVTETVEATQCALLTGTALILTLVLVTIPDTVFGVILYQLAIVDTRCKFCPCCIGIGKCLFRHTEYFAIVICAISFTVGMWLLNWHPPWDALEVLAWGKLYSYGAWFIIWFFLPCQLGFISLWSYEAKEAKKREEEEEACIGNNRSGNF